MLLHFYTGTNTIASFKFYPIKPPDKQFYKQNYKNIDQAFTLVKCVLPPIILNFKLNRLQFASDMQTTNYSATSTNFVSLKALYPDGACITEPILNVSKTATLDRHLDTTTLSSVTCSPSKLLP